MIHHRASAFSAAAKRPPATVLTEAAPIDGRNHGRTPAVRLVLDERDKLLVEAARFFPGLSQRETARQLRSALMRYRAGAWRRDRAEATCPPQHKGKLVQTLWCLLKTKDAIPGPRMITMVLARSS
jgi:hypothetical protein